MFVSPFWHGQAVGFSGYTFTSNSSGYASGAVHLQGSPTTITNNTFFANTANGYNNGGGAISTDVAGASLIVDCMFMANRASSPTASDYGRGGAIMIAATGWHHNPLLPVCEQPGS
ncbi:MAG: hypothetical protein JXN60_04025 [Lentisphaerae bacterium]|nr:hypothetical protein [Lentisphaerota bacterium]